MQSYFPAPLAMLREAGPRGHILLANSREIIDLWHTEKTAVGVTVRHSLDVCVKQVWTERERDSFGSHSHSIQIKAAPQPDLHPRFDQTSVSAALNHSERPTALTSDKPRRRVALLTWQGQGAEAGGQRLAQRLQVLVEEAVASPLLHHVALQPLHGGAHALHVLLQGGVALLVLHVGLAELTHLRLASCSSKNIKDGEGAAGKSKGPAASGCIIYLFDLCAPLNFLNLFFGRLFWDVGGTEEYF